VASKDKRAEIESELEPLREIDDRTLLRRFYRDADDDALAAIARHANGDARVALSATHPDDPFRALMIRGRVVKVTEDGAEDGIDRLARKYIGGERYEWRRPGEVRVAYYIQPETVKTL